MVPVGECDGASLEKAALLDLCELCRHRDDNAEPTDPYWFADMVEECCLGLEETELLGSESLCAQLRRAVDLAEVANEDDEQVAVLEGAYGVRRPERERDPRSDERYLSRLAAGEEACGLAVAVYACMRSLNDAEAAARIAGNGPFGESQAENLAKCLMAAISGAEV